MPSPSAGQVEIINANCLSALELLPSDSVDCVVTSPPYWGLRDHGVTGAIGLEPSLAEHMAALVAVFREVRRVLKPTGTLWINYGDAYACQPNGRSAADTKAVGNDDRTFRDKPINTVGGTLKPKDRMMLPARLAIALCDDGWWLRDEIVWHKPNPMPSSVRDRTTPAHEMIYLFSKRPRYFFDQEAIKEESVTDQARASKKRGEFNGKTEALPGRNAFRAVTPTRNKRSVWTVLPKPFREAHFATFPPALIEPCILAGCPAEVCSTCGKPWVRIVEKGEPLREWQQACGGDADGQYDGQATKDFAAARAQNASDVKRRILEGMRESITLGFKPTCQCAAPTRPGVVLDPFGGAGTTGLVAQQHGRDSILIELNADYCAIARKRLGTPVVSEVTTDRTYEDIFA